MTDQLYGQLSMHGIDPLHGNHFYVRKRDGRREEFNEARIFLAIESAFRATLGIEPNEALRDVLQIEIKNVTDPVIQQVLSRAVKGEELGVEAIQDAVEEQLMRAGHLAIARRYILYRDERRRARLCREKAAAEAGESSTQTPSTSAKAPAQSPTGTKSAVPVSQWAAIACRGLEQGWSVDRLVSECLQKVDPGIGVDEWESALGEAAKLKVAREPAYERVATRVLLRRIYRQALPKSADLSDMAGAHQRQFASYIAKAVESRQLSHELPQFNLELLAAGLRPERDEQFGFVGLQALHDEYLLREKGECIETPQYFWMRLAMGLALNEGHQREARAIEFYEALSSFRFIPSASILFNAGTATPYLTDCYSTTGWSDLEHITARTGGRFGERQVRGTTCSWLELWHIKILDFLANSHRSQEFGVQDLSKGGWIPDLFMKRVRENGHWTLFDPSDAPELHRLSGGAFERRYVEYEAQADRGEMQAFERLSAQVLWEAILASMCDTGLPLLGFKDTANARSMQDNGGVVQSAGLSGDILLPSAPSRASACGVGAINLAAHVTGEGLGAEQLLRTVETAMRLLDNTLDSSAYPDGTAATIGMEQRPIALGIAGFQDTLQLLKLSYASPAAVELADRSMESVSYFAILASSALALERGAYPGFEKSKWKLGLLPIDTLELMQQERGTKVDIDRSSRHDWAVIRERIQAQGLRHCATTAITPMNEGAAIMGVTPSVEPALYLNVGKAPFGKAAQWNHCLVADLKESKLWNNQLVAALQDSNGSIQQLAAVPASLKEIYRTAYEIETRWLIECAARRQKWLDMSQALTLYVRDADLARMSEIYMLAWEKGLKTARQLPALACGVSQSEMASLALKRAQAPEESRKFAKIESAGIVPMIVS